MTDQSKTLANNIMNPNTWMRLLYMILFAVLLPLVRMIVWVIAAVQFLLVLFTGKDNPHLRDLGQGISKWSLQALLFLTYNSEEKPFPFADWPEINSIPEIDNSFLEATEAAVDTEIPPSTEENDQESGKHP